MLFNVILGGFPCLVGYIALPSCLVDHKYKTLDCAIFLPKGDGAARAIAVWGSQAQEVLFAAMLRKTFCKQIPLCLRLA